VVKTTVFIYKTINFTAELRKDADGIKTSSKGYYSKTIHDSSNVLTDFGGEYNITT